MAITVVTDLSSVIRKAQAKSSSAEDSRIQSNIVNAQINAAEERVKSAESQVTRYELSKSDAEDKLSPPPTKTVQGDGKKGGSKTVVDERERDKLQAQVRAAQVQIDQAVAAVDAARMEAQDLKSNSLETAGIPEQQQQEMFALLSEIDSLKTLSNDAQEDLTGDNFQEKLNASIEKIDKLAEDLPDSANPVLQDFWEEVEDGLSHIHGRINDFITPDPSHVDTGSDKSYAGYFDDVEQGFDSILGHLQGEGVGDEILQLVANSRDSVTNEEGNYLAGMTEDDNLVLQDFLTHIDTMVGKINKGEAITNDDIAELTLGAQDTADVLASGGSAFESTIEIQFNTIANNLSELAETMGNDPDFANLYGRLGNIFENPANDFSDLAGISIEEVESLKAYSQHVTDLKNQSKAGEEISVDDFNHLINEGHAFSNHLINNYGFTDAAAGTGGGSSGGSGGGGSSGGGGGSGIPGLDRAGGAQGGATGNSTIGRGNTGSSRRF